MKTVFTLIPNAFVDVTGNLLDSSEVQQYAVEYADFMGDRWAVGDGIWNYTSAPIQSDNGGPEAYGSDMRVFFMLYLLAKLNVASGPENPITLGLSCPPGLYNQVAKKIKQGFLIGESGKRDGIWTIKLSSQKAAKEYHIRHVAVMPAGFTTFAAYIWDIMGNNVPEAEQWLDTRVDILDLGYGTGDRLTIRNGKLNSDNISHSSDFNGGIRALIVEPALQVLNKMTGATHLHEAMVNSWLKQWQAMNTAQRHHWIMKIAGKEVALDVIFAPLVRRYVIWVIQHQIEPALRAGVRTIMITGGGWYLCLPAVQSHLQQYWPAVRLILPDMFDHTRGIPLHHLNAYGAIPAIMQALR